MAKTALEILTEARALIATPERWTQGSDAKDAEGDPSFADDGNAVCWCAVGAINKVVATPGEQDGAASRLAAHLGMAFSNVPEFNDHRFTDHADVLSLFDRAIAAERARQAGEAA